MTDNRTNRGTWLLAALIVAALILFVIVMWPGWAAP